jgi:hypothetical protein
MIKTLEQYYLSLAEEYQAKGQLFEAAYYRKCAFEAKCLEAYI